MSRTMRIQGLLVYRTSVAAVVAVMIVTLGGWYAGSNVAQRLDVNQVTFFEMDEFSSIEALASEADAVVLAAVTTDIRTGFDSGRDPQRQGLANASGFPVLIYRMTVTEIMDADPGPASQALDGGFIDVVVPDVKTMGVEDAQSWSYVPGSDVVLFLKAFNNHPGLTGSSERLVFVPISYSNGTLDVRSGVATARSAAIVSLEAGAVHSSGAGSARLEVTIDQVRNEVATRRP